MTTSTFSVTRDDVNSAALRLCGALAQGQTATTEDLSNCTLALNVMLKFWITQGYKAWLYRTITFAAVAGKASYTIGPAGADVTTDRPVRIPQGYTIDANNNKLPIIIVPRQQFELLTPSTQPGPTNTGYYDPQLGAGVFYPWPIPTDTSRSFVLLEQRPINDISASSGTDTFDIPQEWYMAIKWGLAEQIMLEYGTPEGTMRRIEQKAAIYLTQASDWNEEDASVFFQIDPQGGFQRGRG